MNQRIQEQLDRIHALKKQINALRPLSQSELHELKKWYDVTYTFHSNAIEGNSLTLEETRVVVEDGLTVEGHPLRELIEAKNHKEMIDELVNVVKEKRSIDETLVLKFFRIFMKDIDDTNAGRYRDVQVYITGEEQLPPPATDVPRLMNELFAWYEEATTDTDPVLLAFVFHYRFVKIHPFIDGNGRLARILTNLILMRAGYPLMIVPVVRRREYIAGLKSTAPQDQFILFMGEVLVENMKDYLRMVTKG